MLLCIFVKKSLIALALDWYLLIWMSQHWPTPTLDCVDKTLNFMVDFKVKLDRGSTRSRYGLSTPYRLTITKSLLREAFIKKKKWFLYVKTFSDIRINEVQIRTFTFWELTFWDLGLSFDLDLDLWLKVFIIKYSQCS